MRLNHNLAILLLLGLASEQQYAQALEMQNA